MALTPPNWISEYWSYIDEQGNERDPSKAMIDWLSNQPPVVWHAFVTQYMNWDSALRVGYWILNQRECDRATAAFLLFTSEPHYYLKLFKQGKNQTDFETTPLSWSEEADFYPESTDFIKAILSNFKKGYYQDSNILQEIGSYHLKPYNEIM